MPQLTVQRRASLIAELKGWKILEKLARVGNLETGKDSVMSNNQKVNLVKPLLFSGYKNALNHLDGLLVTNIVRK
jgi:hypothetical protein